MLALASGLEIVHEPFNPGTGPGVFGLPPSRRRSLAYVCAENEGEYRAAMADTLAFRYGYLRQLAVTRSRAALTGSVADARRFHAARRDGARPLLKDACAVFAAEWIADRFDAKVVVLIRHPAAFVSSVLRLGWAVDCGSHFLDQPLLLRDRLSEYELEMRELSARSAPPLEHAILFWRAVYATVRTYRELHPNWIFRRHEDLAANPDASFRELCLLLGLDYSDALQQQVLAHSAAGNPIEPDSPHDVRLDSRASIGNWRRRLTDDQIELIRASTADVWPDFYAEEDWLPSPTARVLDRAERGRRSERVLTESHTSRETG